MVPVSVNVSRKLLYDLNFVEKYNRILSETAVEVLSLIHIFLAERRAAEKN